LLPVLFVFQPALILKGDLPTILQAVVTALAAILLLASAFEGHLYGLGRLPLWARVGIGIAGLLLLVPEGVTDLIGIALAAAFIGAAALLRPAAVPLAGEQRLGK